MSKDVASIKPVGKKSAMDNAVKGTEKIREWDEHRVGTEALEKKYNTNIKTGLDNAGAKKG